MNKVLFVDTISGSNDYPVELVNSLSSKAKLTVITVNNTNICETLPLKLLKVIPQYGGRASKYRKLINLFVFYFILIKELFRHKNDVVHIQFFRNSFFELFIYSSCKLFLKRLVFTAHNALPHEKKFWHLFVYRLWYCLLDDVIVLGEYTRNQLISLGVNPNKINVIPHGNYDMFYQKYSSGHPEEGANLSTEKSLTFLMYGLIRDYKGVDVFAKAIQALPHGLNVKFKIAGAAGDAIVKEAHDLIQDSFYSKSTLLINRFLENQELADLIATSDVLVFPYRHIYQSGALLLGMTYGKAIITTDLPGFKDYVVRERHALMFEVDNFKELSAIILNLSRSPKLVDEYKNASKQKAYADYDWGNIANLHIQLYFRNAD